MLMFSRATCWRLTPRVSLIALMFALLLGAPFGAPLRAAPMDGAPVFLPLIAHDPPPPPLIIEWLNYGLQHDGRIWLYPVIRSPALPAQRTVTLRWEIDIPTAARSDFCVINHSIGSAAIPVASLSTTRVMTIPLTLPSDSANCRLSIPPDQTATFQQRVWWLDVDPPLMVGTQTLQVRPTTTP